MTQETFWQTAGRRALYHIVLHVIDLNGGEAVRVSQVSKYVGERDLSSLDTALISSDDATIRVGWRVFMRVEEKAREAVLRSIKTVLSGLADSLIPRGGVEEMVESLEL